MKSLQALFCLFVTFLGCVESAERQSGNLLPETNSLELLEELEIGITHFYLYKMEGTVDVEKLSKLPIDIASEKAVVSWHRVEERELQDIRLFIQEEQASNKLATDLLENLSKGREYLIALTYDKDKYPIGTQGYSVYDWVDLFFLDLKDSQLLHISYGKF